MKKVTLIGLIAAVIILAAAIAGTYLFSMDRYTGLEDDLNKGIISEELKNEFKSKGFSLSDNVTIRKESDYEWVIDDKETRRIYSVKKEGGKLSIGYFHPTPGPPSISPAPYQPEPEPETIVAYPGGSNFTIPLNLTYPHNQSLKPLGYGIVPLPPLVEGFSPTGRDISVDTYILVEFSRWIPPEVVKLEIEPYVEMSHFKKEIVVPGIQKFTFYPAKPLQSNTDYTVKVTFGLMRTGPYKYDEEYCAPYQTITWDFTTEVRRGRG